MICAMRLSIRTHDLADGRRGAWRSEQHRSAGRRRDSNCSFRKIIVQIWFRDNIRQATIDSIALNTACCCGNDSADMWQA